MKILSEKAFFRLIGIAAIVLSFAGVFYAVKISNDRSDGGRGGALADAIALAALFGTRNYAADTYEALTRRSPKRMSRILKLKKSHSLSNHVDSSLSIDNTENFKIEAIEKRLNLEAEGQSIQNFWLAVATFVGTIFAGFGDLFAGLFIRH